MRDRGGRHSLFRRSPHIPGAMALQRLMNLRQRCGDEVRLMDTHLLGVERIGDHLAALADENVIT